MTIYPGAALTATLLAGHGLRKGSLSTSGAIAAWAVGYGHLANPLKVFGVSMIVFYLVGSRATKFKAAQKAKYEDGIDPLKPSGNRNWVQVLSNSVPSLIAAIVYRFTVSHQVDGSHQIIPLHPLARPVIFAALGHLGNTLADTLASELGILSTSPPRSILTLRPVPPGTNGGISPLGLGASVLGGAVMGLTMVLDLLVESESARTALKRGRAGWGSELVLFGAAAGLGGSLLDSLLGATLQRTEILPNGKIRTDHSLHASSEVDDPQRVDEAKKVGVGLDVLSNSGVNAVCGFVLAGLGYWYGSR